MNSDFSFRAKLIFFYDMEHVLIFFFCHFFNIVFQCVMNKMLIELQKAEIYTLKNGLIFDLIG